jgi:hypothetical protein
MGDNFLRQQAKNFRKRKDLALEKANHPPLFKRPDDINRIFLGKPCSNESYTAGERLWAMIEPNDHTITLVRNHQKVGFVDGEGADVLKDALINKEGPSIIPMHVNCVFDLSHVAQLQLSEEFRNE